MNETRCKFCHRLLAKVNDKKDREVIIRCPKCKTDNEIDLAKK